MRISTTRQDTPKATGHVLSTPTGQNKLSTPIIYESVFTAYPCVSLRETRGNVDRTTGRQDTKPTGHTYVSAFINKERTHTTTHPRVSPNPTGHPMKALT